MKIITICILISLLVGCTTEKKAETWMDAHPEIDAGRCAMKYPARDSIRVVIDSAGSALEIKTLMDYSDTVTQIADARNRAIVALSHTIDSLKEAGAYSESVARQLANEIDSIPQVDVPTLTRQIEAKVRATIKPCHDSVITRIDGARATYDSLRIARLAQDSIALAQMKLDKKNPAITAGWTLTALLGKWWFWLILLGAAAFITRKEWIPLLKL